jgi:glyoxylase-like metal-dependent hydrolase (beta-lactamase superfamily II)
MTLRLWSAPHAEWKREVTSLAVETRDGLVLIDPLAPPADLGAPAHVLVSVFFHARDAGSLGARVWAPTRLARRLANRGVAVTDPLEPGREGPGGIRCLATARDGEVAYWLPQQRALWFGDVVLGEPRLRLCPKSWLGSATVAELKGSLRPLLDLPVEQLLLSHGPSVRSGGRAALAALLA